LGSGVMADEGVIPEYEGKGPDELFGIYKGFHEINPDKRINKPRARERRVRKHRRPLTEIVEGYFAENQDSFEGLSEGESKKRAAAIITKIAHAHYKSKDANAKKPTEDQVREFLQEAGIDATYEDVIKQVMNATDLRYDNLQNTAAHLKSIIDFTALYKDGEGRKIALLQQRLTRPENQEGLRKLVGAETKRRYHPSATPGEILGEYQDTVEILNTKYDMKRPKTHSRAA
tara:strand:- start:106 stop:798 length:693 start_codon:yes stop_codon:yes gene_type:complete